MLGVYYNIPMKIGMGRQHRLPFMFSEFSSGRKEVRPMNFSVILDWKFIAALGAAVSGIILSAKMEPDAAERVSTHVVDACKEYMVAGNGNQ